MTWFIPSLRSGEGYVPNVVYTCGAMRNRDQIILPYAVSDTFSSFATITDHVVLRDQLLGIDAALGSEERVLSGGTFAKMFHPKPVD